jgi:hypothetical protein
MGTCDGYSRTTEYFTASAVNGGKICDQPTVTTDLCGHCQITSSSIGTCDGKSITTRHFTVSAFNGGDECTVEPTVINACAGKCSTTSTEFGKCENGSALTTYHVDLKGEDGLRCEPAIATGKCDDVISSQEKFVFPGILGWLMIVLL